VSERLDKLRRLQVAVDDLLAAVREVDQNLESSEAADLQSVIDEMEEESIRSKMSIEARDRELKEWNRMWHEQVDEVRRLTATVEWYKKAERLLVWNGTEWQVRQDAAKEGR
jgi:predicted RNase H-like nuclease (RuvC/YqgF family)